MANEDELTELERGHWLTAERVRVYPRIFVALYLVIYTVYFISMHELVDFRGQPVGCDFIAFWSASWLGVAGRAVTAYSIPVIAHVERMAVPGEQATFPWFYPPPFLMAVLPLALMPYVVSWITFISATLAAYLSVLARIVRRYNAGWLVAAFPALWICAINGQNGFLTAVLAAGALVMFDRRPLVAGGLVGLMIIKPQLAVVWPIALAASGLWWAFAAAGFVAVAFLGVSAAVVGPATIPAWLNSMGSARLAMEVGALPWVRMPSVFAMFRMLGAPVQLSYAAQTLVGLIALAAVWRIWRHDRSLPLRGASLMTAIFLVTPFCYDYDLVWLAFPIAWMAIEGRTKGWLAGEREILVAAWVLPLFVAPLAKILHLGVGPIVLLALLGMIVRRHLATSTTAENGTRREGVEDEGLVG